MHVHFLKKNMTQSCVTILYKLMATLPLLGSNFLFPVRCNSVRSKVLVVQLGTNIRRPHR